ncbi:MAG: ABC transporter substrate-binding protein [Chloroflexi bacterium]|nr:ABC transporter substrate-binding protein [Chloroflexota bacterium]
MDRITKIKIGRRKFLRVSAMVAAGGVLLAACGDTVSPTNTPAAGTTTVAGGATSLKLGVLLPFSGVYTQLGLDIVDGMNLYFESIGGVVAGRKIELLKEDEENDPQAALRKTKKLIESDKVDLLTGIVSSAVALGIRDTVDQAKTILVISNAGAKDITGARFSKYIFRTSFSNGQVPYPLGEWAYKNVGKKIFMTAPDYAAGRESVEGFKATFVKAGGTVVGEVYPPFGKTSDYAPFLTQIQQAKPEAVYAFYSGTEAVNFVKQYEQFGLKKDIPLVAAGFIVEQDTLPALGGAALGIKSTLHYADSLDTPENKKFVADFTSKYKRTPTTFALQGFDSARFIVEGLKVVNGDTTNKENLVKALEGVKFISPRGPLEIDPTNHGLTQNIYLRDVVAGSDGKPMNKVISTFEKIQDINTLLKN